MAVIFVISFFVEAGNEFPVEEVQVTEETRLAA
jgi:hypothetical protein